MAGKLRPDQVEELRVVFNELDDDKSGAIDAGELEDVFKAQGQALTRHEIEQMIEQIDTDGNGTVEFDEFCELMAANLQETDLTEEFVRAFAERDSNKTGFCSKSELRRSLTSTYTKVLKSLESKGNPLTDADIDTMTQEAVVDTASGEVDYRSFVMHMMGT